jgi:hypothetical protein
MRAYGSKRRPGGSIDQWTQIRITSMRSRSRIREKLDPDQHLSEKLDPNTQYSDADPHAAYNCCGSSSQSIWVGWFRTQEGKKTQKMEWKNFMF